MEVILQENFLALGYVGDRVKVRRGFARNYLIPRGIAVEASPFNERLLKHKLSVIQGKKLKLKSEAEEYSKRLEGVALEFHLRGSQQGKSFGVIGARDIETELEKQGFQISRKQIKLLDPLRKAGEYKVPVKLHAEVHASLSVKIIADVQESKPAKKSRKKGERAAKGSKELENKQATEGSGESAGQDDAATPELDPDQMAEADVEQTEQ